ncbi:UBX domain-containing protein 7-like [Saccostrea cucullata]|uniref:UBX domain-containing protein 7-like n=1 Tax=Saccostrea cuccullata TaxID=36930 RepID=UPI002ED00057
MTSTNDKIEQFCSITGADQEVGRNLLEACNGNLELAIDMHMDSGGAPAPPPAGQRGPRSVQSKSSSTRGASASAPIDVE